MPVLKSFLSPLIFFGLLCVLLFMQSCNPYKYFPPPVNSPTFEGAGEVHVSGNAGLTGYSGKAGISITDNFAITGMYHHGRIGENFNEENSIYRSYEGEVAFGLYNFTEKPKFTAIYLGFGTGSNFDRWKYSDSVRNFEYKRFYGDFYRPFIQVSTGKINDGAALAFFGSDLAGKVRSSHIFSFKLNYRGYDNNLDSLKNPTPAKFNAENTFFEPYYNYTIGSKNIRFELGVGMPLNFTFLALLDDSKREVIRIFPLNAQVGLYFALGGGKEN
jgi:hypothetical protein